jgi:hypothetical protein
MGAIKSETRTPGKPVEQTWLPVLILLALIAAAVILRVYQLDSGLWLDEILTYLNYASLPFEEIVSTYDTENQHFLYSLLARLSFEIFGESNWSLRLPAVVFGVLSIPAAYLLGREVTNWRESLLAAALLTFSYQHIWFSQNARGYSGLLFWSILSSWLLLRSISKDTLSLWVLFAAAAALGVYTHLTMGFMILGQFCVYLYRFICPRKGTRPVWWRGLVVGFGGTAVLTLFLHAPVLSQMTNTIGGSEVSVVSEWKNPLWTLLEVIEGLRIEMTSVVFVMAALILFTVGLVSYFRSRLEVVLFLAVPSVAGAAVVVAIGHHLWPRFFYFLFGFGALVVMRGAMRAGEKTGRLFKLSGSKSAWLGTCICIGLILISAVSVPLAYGPKQDYKGAYQYLLSHKQEGDAVLTFDLAGYVYDEFIQTDWTMVESVEELEDMRRKAKRTWVVFTFKPVSQSLHPELMARIEKDFKLQATFKGSVGDGEVYIYLSNASSG